MMEALYSQEKVTNMARAEARAEGIGIGEAKGFWKLVCRKLLTNESAAKELGVSVAQFDKMCEEYAFAK